MGRALPKDRILRGHRAFARVLEDGVTRSQSPVRCFVRIDPTSRRSLRVGFSVSRALRSAAKRNRARRLLKEAFRLNYDRVTTDTAGMELVLMFVGKESDSPSWDAVQRSVQGLLGNLQRP